MQAHGGLDASTHPCCRVMLLLRALGLALVAQALVALAAAEGRAELEALTLKNLKAKARELGVEAKTIEELDDAADPKSAAVELVQVPACMLCLCLRCCLFALLCTHEIQCCILPVLPRCLVVCMCRLLLRVECAEVLMLAAVPNMCPPPLPVGRHTIEARCRRRP